MESKIFCGKIYAHCMELALQEVRSKKQELINHFSTEYKIRLLPHYQEHMRNGFFVRSINQLKENNPMKRGANKNVSLLSRGKVRILKN